MKNTAHHFPHVYLFLSFYKRKKFVSQHSIKITVASIMLLTLFVLPEFFNNHIYAQVQNGTGNLVGSISYGDEKRRIFIEFSPETTIILSSRGQKKIISSDENGDYFPELPVGRYCIISIFNKEGKKLRTWSNQYTCFDIRKEEVTRFDISLLLKNSEKYHTKLSDAKVSESENNKTSAKSLATYLLFKPIKFLHGIFFSDDRDDRKEAKLPK